MVYVHVCMCVCVCVCVSVCLCVCVCVCVYERHTDRGMDGRTDRQTHKQTKRESFCTPFRQIVRSSLHEFFTCHSVSQDFGDFMKEHKLIPAPPTVLADTEVKPFQKGRTEAGHLHILCKHRHGHRHLHWHTCIFTHRWVICLCVYTVHALMHPCLCTHTRACTSIHAQGHTHERTHAHTCACTHACTHTRCMHIRTHAHTHYIHLALPFSISVFLFVFLL